MTGETNRVFYLTDRDAVTPEAAGWYFWDENDQFTHGPYPNYRAARDAMIAYVEILRDEAE